MMIQKIMFVSSILLWQTDPSHFEIMIQMNHLYHYFKKYDTKTYTCTTRNYSTFRKLLYWTFKNSWTFFKLLKINKQVRFPLSKRIWVYESKTGMFNAHSNGKSKNDNIHFIKGK